MWNSSVWENWLDRILRDLVRLGTLRTTYPSGRTESYGTGAPVVPITLDDPALPRRLILNPDLALGEAYMDGTLRIGQDDLYGLLSLILTNLGPHRTLRQHRPIDFLRRLARGVLQFNPIPRAQRNVAHHYDLSGDLYDLFLDDDRQYSCAYFKTPQDSLEHAQTQKKAHIARKLLLKPGMSVLDIGCGWGGLALALARDHGVNVVGVTLSREQYAVASRRAQEQGLANQVEFRLQDYRHVPEQYDRIVSVGMFEHVGAPHFRTFFRGLNKRLRRDGIALLHTIGRSGPPSVTSPWINKYIFPGGYVPALSETASAIEQERLRITDVEVLRLHYAQTLKHWHDRFMTNIDAASALYDARFCRMWRFYLVASELTFRLRDQVVFQIQLSHDQTAVPLTRDYLYPHGT